MTKFDRTPEKTVRAQLLRSEMTLAERKLWAKLKRRQVHGLKFRRQHPIGSYILDFYCSEIKLCIELDGEQHGYENNIKKDKRRTLFLEAKNISVIRFWNSQIFKSLDEVVDTIFDHAWYLKRETEVMRDAIPSPWKGEG